MSTLTECCFSKVCSLSSIQFKSYEKKHDIACSRICCLRWEHCTSAKMPPKSKRKLQLEAARARKVAKLDESSESRPQFWS